MAGASTLAIAADMALRGYRQRIRIMHVVHPVTALRRGRHPSGSTPATVDVRPVR
ncbi:hypothetical protein ABZT04_42365 [Streptomyces sp. NPDC005492]|uniref:hypothetical protein n=1 Tax=Streptomyces sp. NPDC005492 TaxID=3156883 RepID=UPI0033AB8BB0